MVERFNRTLLDMLATAVGDHPSDWEIHIRKLCFAYNTSTHSSTGYSPYFLMFGRQATIPVNLMYCLNQGKEKTLPDFVQHLREGLSEAYALVRERCELEHQRQKAIQCSTLKASKSKKFGFLLVTFQPYEYKQKGWDIQI